MRVLVGDRDERIRRRLGTWVCAEAPDVALIDVHLAVYGGATWPRHVPFALTTSPFDDVSLRFADTLGALGVIAKDAPGLREAARRLADGVQVHIASSHPAP